MGSEARVKFALDGKGRKNWAWQIARMEDSVRMELPPFTCAGCGIPLTFVNSSTRAEASGGVKVHAHFRVLPMQRHSEVCPVTPAGVILRAKNKKPSLLQEEALRVPLDPLMEGIAAEGDEHPFLEAVGSLLDLAEDLIGTEAEVTAIDKGVKFSARGRAIPWETLYMPHGNYHRCLESMPLAANGEVEKDPQVIILQGEVKGLVPVKNGVRVLLVAEAATLVESGEKVFIRPAFRIFKKWAWMFAPGVKVLLAARYQANLDIPTGASRAPTVWLNLQIQRLRQVRVVEVDQNSTSIQLAARAAALRGAITEKTAELEKAVAASDYRLSAVLARRLSDLAEEASLLEGQGA